jgi:putative membrane protein
MMKQRTCVLASLAAVAGWLIVTCAAPGGGGVGKVVTDAEFVRLASASDLAEINLGRMAATQAGSPEVKQFAEKLVADHTKASKELLGIADKQRLTVAPRMDAKHVMLANKLLNLKGADFDRAFMESQVKDHKEAVALFQAQASSGKDPQLKAFAAKTLPEMQKHLKKAEEIYGKLKGGAKGGGSR